MRLIDADALMEQYDLKDATKYGNKNEEQQAHSYSTLMLYEIADMIEDAPTAYDVDKVVEELEERKHEICLSDDDLEYYQNGIDEAIEIVKHGGISDDVCEWKQDNMFEAVYRACGGFSTTVYQKDFEYCPYCGKKIKVVGD